MLEFVLVVALAGWPDKTLTERVPDLKPAECETMVSFAGEVVRKAGALRLVSADCL